MLFETEKKALTFMKFNNEEIRMETGVTPKRAYFCEACGGWHLTHHAEDWTGPSPTELAISQMKKITEIRKSLRHHGEENPDVKMDPDLSNFISMQLNKIDSYVKANKITMAELLVDVLLDLLKCKPTSMRKKTEERLNVLKNTFAETQSMQFGDEKQEYLILPYKNVSYAIAENGDPLSTFYHPQDGLFYVSPRTQNDNRYFLDIIKPVLIFVDNVEEISIPKQLPEESDGVIFKKNITNQTIAFYVVDKNKQSIRY